MDVQNSLTRFKMAAVLNIQETIHLEWLNIVVISDKMIVGKKFHSFDLLSYYYT